MLQNLIVFYLNALIIICLMNLIQGDCKVKFPSDPALRPNFYKFVGTHRLKLNLNGEKNQIVLKENEEIEAECDVKFEGHSDFELSNKLGIQCNNYLYVKVSEDSYYKEYYSADFTLRCSYLKWQLYELTRPLPWCLPAVSSYILFSRTNVLSLNYWAGICFDIFNLTFHSMYYAVGADDSEYTHPFNSTALPFVEVNYDENIFKNNKISAYDFKDLSLRKWFKLLNYELSSIVQVAKLHSVFIKNFSTLYEIMWWSNLRQYNWKHYTETFQNHVKKERLTYDILAGASGTIKVPLYDKCKFNYSMNELVDDYNRKIPMYIWNYLKLSSDNTTNDMVIIGFNSPFDEFYSKEQIIFCPDKCHEIPWLKNISLNFRYNIMGTVFCCTVKDVRSSNRLMGFPDNDLPTRPNEEKDGGKKQSNTEKGEKKKNE